ncbi:MAG: sigma 54-interacting transcriptional regulator [Firmicutes bacterium]|nr:sigma 54-interacting transcriptional regulator [Bacillota bacterium]MCL5040170.1 sigma 54-interacting transcriptional regulator [Bacillota bacterium]
MVALGGENRWGGQEAEPFLKAILESVEEGIHAVDLRGITVFYNQAAARLEGVEQDEILGQDLLQVFPSLSRETSTLLRVLDTGQPIVDQQQTYTNFRGKQITTINTTLPIHSGGRLIGAVEVSKDITHIKRLAERVNDLEARLRDAAGGRSRVPPTRYQLSDLKGESRAIAEVRRFILRAAEHEAPVFVSGETGTGKEIVAQSIHQASQRREGPFIAQNCAALPATLLDSILFGTVKGSFTGSEARPGLFELADGGTLFLDEITSMQLDLQAKLLRGLEEGRIRRLGATRERSVHVRVIAATNLTPEEALGRALLREDLFYRLNVLSIRLPPLRERREDITLLVEHFAREFERKGGHRLPTISPEVFHKFSLYPWPGNVRELKHTLEGALSLMDGDLLEVGHLPERIRNYAPGVDEYRESGSTSLVGHPSPITPGGTREPIREAIRKLEGEFLREALAESGGNLSEAARRLGLPRQTLQYRLRKAGLK